MKPLPSKLPPEPDDFFYFRKAVRKAPPVFIAILIVLGLGVVLSRLVFTTYSSHADAGAFISMKGAMQFGEEETGPDEKEGAKGEDDRPEPDPPAKEPEEEPEEESPLEPARWLDQVPAPAPMGPLKTAPSKPEKGKSTAIKPAVSGGGKGKGEKGTGTGTGSPWGSREAAGRGEGTRRFGGNSASESAVELGLNWLRRHQAMNGVWRADGFTSRCRPGDPCGNEALDSEGYYDGGVTALVVMAFLGAGYTHHEGRFRNTVNRALEHLLRIQKPTGRFGSENMYTQSLAVIALAEAYGMTGDTALRGALKKGLNFLIHAQQPQGGWTYDPAPRKERNDTSITSFAVMALKSARATGLFVPERTLDRARAHFLKATRETGDVVYADAGLGVGRQGAGMIAAGLFTTFLLGRSPDHPLAKSQIARLKANVPVWGDDHSLDQSLVTWYYQNLVFFSLGGADWARWNPGFRDLLVSKQHRGGCADGSWEPFDLWGRTGGRVYSTAINVLNLEIYYKYTPSFLRPSEKPWLEDGTSGPYGRGSRKAGERGKEEKTPEEAMEERLKRLRDLWRGK